MCAPAKAGTHDASADPEGPPERSAGPSAFSALRAASAPGARDWGAVQVLAGLPGEALLDARGAMVQLKPGRPPKAD